MPRFFGQFLLERGILRGDQLLKVVELQRSRAKKLGEIAVAKEYLSQNQVDFVLEEQKKTDKMFGELAVTLRLLTPNQVDEIIKEQKAIHTFLGQAVVELGFATGSQMAKLLMEFRKEEEEDEAPQGLVVPKDLPEREVVVLLPDLISKMFRRFASLPVKFSRLRFEEDFTVNPHLLAAIDFKGFVNFQALLKLPAKLSHYLIVKYCEDLDLSEEMQKSTASEFSNIICGHLATKLSDQGLSSDISPPSCFTSMEQDTFSFEGRKATILPFFTSEGYGEMMIVQPADGRRKRS
ncbi:MAG: chemotaxis protein CheX [Armatimonadetes bacterium]|nr:chemotaxis protein CheX [Armatimonadota bacterium]